MKASGFLKVGILLWAILAGVGFLVIQCRGALPTVLYSTGFEASEGFSTNANLVNQNGWVGFGSGGNGVVEGFFAGGGQQAYLGFSPPTGNGDELTIWHPTNFTPTNRAQQVVTFFVKMSIEDSSGANTNYDDFRWSVYNVAAERLFSIDFDNSTFRISYALDGTNGFVFTGETFTNSVAYELVVQMDLAHNSWSAWLGDRVLASNRRITTRGVALTLGDVDAVWLVRTPGAPGNNFMVFDDYLITAEPAPVLPPVLDPPARLPGGQVNLRVLGEPDFRYALEASTNLINWAGLKTNSTASGTLDFQDDGATNLVRRFYRVRLLP